AAPGCGEGPRRGLAGQLRGACAGSGGGGARAPSLPLPAESAAYVALRLAAGEADPARRLRFLEEGEATLREARRHASSGAGSWTLAAQIAFAQARAGDRSKLVASLAAFSAAARIRPNDPQLLGQWGWAWLESGEPVRAREAAARAVALPRGRKDWLAWAVLARASAELGDEAEARRAADTARSLAPPEAARFVDSVLR